MREARGWMLVALLGCAACSGGGAAEDGVQAERLGEAQALDRAGAMLDARPDLAPASSAEPADPAPDTAAPD